MQVQRATPRRFVTKPLAPDEIVPASQFGRDLVQEDWAEEEVARLRLKGDNAFVDHAQSGLITIVALEG